MQTKKLLRERVYKELKRVPRGRVVTYRELARSCNSKAYRVIGSYMRTNKDPVGIPCYKVVKSNGEIGRYSGEGGVKSKIRLLERDGVKVINGKIDLDKYGWKI